MSHFLSHLGELSLPIELNSLYISPPEYQAIVFEEVVNLVDVDGGILDEVTIAVEERESQEGESQEIDHYQREFNVYQYSRDDSMLIKVQSRVNRTLETLSELRIIRRPNYYQLLRVTDTVEGTDVFAVTVEGGEGVRRRASVAEGRGRLLLEGANAILLRRLAAGRFEGSFAGRTVDHAGDLCDVFYQVERIDGDLARVVRTVIGSDGAEEVMTTVLTTEGRIVSHEWSNSQWRLEGVRPEKPKAEEGDEESEEDSEQEVPADLDAYYEKKEDLIDEINEYIKEQPDVHDMIADLMKNLLFDKPEDVIDYSDRFFSDFLGITRDSLNGYKSCSEVDI